MKDKILELVGRRKTLSEKLDFLTGFSLRTKTPEIMNACEEIRYELCKGSGISWFVYPGERIKGQSEFRMYRNGHFFASVISKGEVMRIMESCV